MKYVVNGTILIYLNALKDIVSLRLYSIQIPYTWYTMGKDLEVIFSF